MNPSWLVQAHRVAHTLGAIAHKVGPRAGRLGKAVQVGQAVGYAASLADVGVEVFRATKSAPTDRRQAWGRVALSALAAGGTFVGGAWGGGFVLVAVVCRYRTDAPVDRAHTETGPSVASPEPTQTQSRGSFSTDSSVASSEPAAGA